jgi:hypothetical protein
MANSSFLSISWVSPACYDGGNCAIWPSCFSIYWAQLAGPDDASAVVVESVLVTSTIIVTPTGLGLRPLSPAQPQKIGRQIDLEPPCSTTDRLPL